MPIQKYFKGHGSDVMSSIRKAHPGASDKQVKSEFYATANAHPEMKPPGEKKPRTMKPGQGTMRGKVARLQNIKRVKKFGKKNATQGFTSTQNNS